MNENRDTNMPYERSEDETASLDLFHAGQQAALDSELETAITKLEQSLETAKDSSDPEWVAYIEGTLAYLKEDQATLTAHIQGAGSNAQILSKLAKGLETRGHANYKEDYGN